MEKEIIIHRTLEMEPEEFRAAGQGLINRIADFLEALPRKKVTTGATPREVRAILKDRRLPLDGQDTAGILEECTDLLFEHSLFNGHPRFWGYITSSAAPIGALADLIASSVNANVGAFALSPSATEIERQTIKWLAELIGYQTDGGGLFVSGGNMANFLGFLAARRNKLSGDIRMEGLPQMSREPAVPPWGLARAAKPYESGKRQFTIYCGKSTHTWVQKAADLFGHGANSIRWIALNEHQQMDTDLLSAQISKDIEIGHFPFLVVGNAGSVSTGAVDHLDEIAAICKAEGLWFHIDGAYGGPAAMLPELAGLFQGIASADSIALDPHKWLYSPLEAGCILVRKPQHLQDTFSFHPEYYNFDGRGSDQPLNFHEYGMQNSRGFRALKVWLSLQQIGKNGYARMIRRDIELAGALFRLIDSTDLLQAFTHNLSITTFRYVPDHLPAVEPHQYLNALNEQLLDRLQTGGEVFLSNAVIDGIYCLRVCIVNFRTTYSDLEALVKIVLEEGEKLHEELSAGWRPE